MKSKQFNKFGVTSKYFEVYSAYKTIVERMGYVYNQEFTTFSMKNSEKLDGLYFGNEWKELEPGVLGFSLTNLPKGKVFNLDTQFEKAVKYAEQQYTEYNKLEHVFEQLLDGEYKISNVNNWNFSLSQMDTVELVCKDYARDKDLMFVWDSKGSRRNGLLVIGTYAE